MTRLRERMEKLAKTRRGKVEARVGELIGGYVEAMGGTLRLVAEFPDRPPIVLRGIGALDGEERPSKR